MPSSLSERQSSLSSRLVLMSKMDTRDRHRRLLGDNAALLWRILNKV